MGYNPHARASAQAYEEGEREDLRDRMETALREFLLKQMRIERVGCFDEPDFDDYWDEFLTAVNETNVGSDAYADLKDERAAAKAGE